MWNALFAIFVMASAASADELSDFLSRWNAVEASRGDFHVRFTQEVSSPALAKPSTSQGQLWRFRDGSFRWELGQPPKSMLIRREKSARYWEARVNVWKDIDPSDRRFQSWMPFVGGEGHDLAVLTKDFDVALESAVLTLKPKSGMAKRHLKHIQLQFDESSMRLMQLKVEQMDGGATTMIFSAPEKTGTLDRNTLLGEGN